MLKIFVGHFLAVFTSRHHAKRSICYTSVLSVCSSVCLSVCHTYVFTAFKYYSSASSARKFIVYFSNVNKHELAVSHNSQCNGYWVLSMGIIVYPTGFKHFSCSSVFLFPLFINFLFCSLCVVSFRVHVYLCMQDRQTVNGTCGGHCGLCVPVNRLLQLQLMSV